MVRGLSQSNENGPSGEFPQIRTFHEKTHSNQPNRLRPEVQEASRTALSRKKDFVRQNQHLPTGPQSGYSSAKPPPNRAQQRLLK